MPITTASRGGADSTIRSSRPHRGGCAAARGDVVIRAILGI